MMERLVPSRVEGRRWGSRIVTTPEQGVAERNEFEEPKDIPQDAEDQDLRLEGYAKGGSEPYDRCHTQDD